MSHIDSVFEMSYTPVSPSQSEELASFIQSEDFTTRLSAMLEDYDSLKPESIDEYGGEYIRLSERYRLLDKHFEFGTFQIRTQFVSADKADVPLCHATLYVLTDTGYEPWFSRLGMADPNSVSSDGLFADAETSARRRVLVALGLGNDGSQEISDTENDNARTALKKYLQNAGQELKSLLIAYNSKYQVENLPPLEVNLKSDRGTDAGSLALESLSESDLKSLLAFLNLGGVNNVH